MPNTTAIIVQGAADGAALATRDAGPNWTPTRTYTASADMTTAADISGAPAAGERVVADDILVSAEIALAFEVREETSGVVLAKVFLPANGTAQITLRDGIKTPATGKKLQGRTSAAGNVAVTCCWHSEP